jgi:hypothetical protein
VVSDGVNTPPLNGHAERPVFVKLDGRFGLRTHAIDRFGQNGPAAGMRT